jgi:hypothetical protein
MTEGRRSAERPDSPTVSAGGRDSIGGPDARPIRGPRQGRRRSPRRGSGEGGSGQRRRRRPRRPMGARVATPRLRDGGLPAAPSRARTWSLGASSGPPVAAPTPDRRRMHRRPRLDPLHRATASSRAGCLPQTSRRPGGACLTRPLRAGPGVGGGHGARGARPQRTAFKAAAFKAAAFRQSRSSSRQPPRLGGARVRVEDLEARPFVEHPADLVGRKRPTARETLSAITVERPQERHLFRCLEPSAARPRLRVRARATVLRAMAVSCEPRASPPSNIRSILSVSIGSRRR